MKNEEKNFYGCAKKNSTDGCMIMFCPLCDKEKSDNTYTHGCKTYQHGKHGNGIMYK